MNRNIDAYYDQNGNKWDMKNDRNDMPIPVRQSFQRDHPNADNARWTENNNQWHASYRDGMNRNIDAYYDQNGKSWDIRNDHNYVPDQTVNPFIENSPM